MSELENNDSIVPVPNNQQASSAANEIEPETKEEQSQEQNQVEQKQYVQTIVEKYEKKTAGFWVRFFAFIIDWLVVGAIVGILINPIFYVAGWDMDESNWYAPMSIISAVIYYGYYILTTKLWSQTLGKMIFGLKVVPLEGDKLTWGTVIFRELIGRFISNTVPPVYIMVAFMPKKQSLHDVLNDTIVVHEKIYVKNKETIVEEKIVKDDFDSNTTTQTV